MTTTEKPQKQQQVMTIIMMNNKGPPITAAFSISEKWYHHPKIPATQTHFLLKMDSPILNKFNFENECSLYSRMPLIR